MPRRRISSMPSSTIATSSSSSSSPTVVVSGGQKKMAEITSSSRNIDVDLNDDVVVGQPPKKRKSGLRRTSSRIARAIFFGGKKKKSKSKDGSKTAKLQRGGSRRRFSRGSNRELPAKKGLEEKEEDNAGVDLVVGADDNSTTSSTSKSSSSSSTSPNSSSSNSSISPSSPSRLAGDNDGVCTTVYRDDFSAQHLLYPIKERSTEELSRTSRWSQQTDQALEESPRSQLEIIVAALSIGTGATGGGDGVYFDNDDTDDENETGMKGLLSLAKSTSGGIFASRALVYGAEGTTKDDVDNDVDSDYDDDDDDSVNDDIVEELALEHRLRKNFLKFLCDRVDKHGHDDDDDEDDSSVYSDLSGSGEFDIDEFVDTVDDGRDDDLRGKNFGALHRLALEILVVALEQVLAAESLDVTSSSALLDSGGNNGYSNSSTIDFSDIFWSNVIDTLIHNIETDHSHPHAHHITGLSLKVMRLLHTLEPLVVKPMLQHTLMPYLMYLQEYGKKQKYPLVESEASRLIKRGEIITTRFIEI